VQADARGGSAARQLMDDVAAVLVGRMVRGVLRAHIVVLTLGNGGNHAVQPRSKQLGVNSTDSSVLLVCTCSVFTWVSGRLTLTRTLTIGGHNRACAPAIVAMQLLKCARRFKSTALEWASEHCT
jgi:hypothetical protein